MTEGNSAAIREIEEAALGHEKVAASRVKCWLQNPSVEVLGAVTQHFLRNSKRIEPPLAMEEICISVQIYYRECLIQNLPFSGYTPNRSIAGFELVGWFRSLWHDPAVPREYLVRLKLMLRDLCLEHKVPLDQLVNTVLEHLFETPGIAEFFSDWKQDARLCEAYALAMDWARENRSQP